MANIYLSSLVPIIQHQFHEHKALIIMIVIGMVAGLLAQMILPGRGFGIISTVIIGCTGAWIGDKYIKAYITFIESHLLRHIAAATIGAMILTLLINLIRGGKDKDKTDWRHG